MIICNSQDESTLNVEARQVENPLNFGYRFFNSLGDGITKTFQNLLGNSPPAPQGVQLPKTHGRLPTATTNFISNPQPHASNIPKHLHQNPPGFTQPLPQAAVHQLPAQPAFAQNNINSNNRPPVVTEVFVLNNAVASSPHNVVGTSTVHILHQTVSNLNTNPSLHVSIQPTATQFSSLSFQSNTLGKTFGNSNKDFNHLNGLQQNQGIKHHKQIHNAHHHFITHQSKQEQHNTQHSNSQLPLDNSLNDISGQFTAGQLISQLLTNASKILPAETVIHLNTGGSDESIENLSFGHTSSKNMKQKLHFGGWVGLPEGTLSFQEDKSTNGALRGSAAVLQENEDIVNNDLIFVPSISLEPPNFFAPFQNHHAVDAFGGKDFTFPAGDTFRNSQANNQNNIRNNRFVQQTARPVQHLHQNVIQQGHTVHNTGVRGARHTSLEKENVNNQNKFRISHGPWSAIPALPTPQGQLGKALLPGQFGIPQHLEAPQRHEKETKNRLKGGTLHDNSFSITMPEAGSPAVRSQLFSTIDADNDIFVNQNEDEGTISFTQVIDNADSAQVKEAQKLMAALPTIDISALMGSTDSNGTHAFDTQLTLKSLLSFHKKPCKTTDIESIDPTDSKHDFSHLPSSSISLSSFVTPPSLEERDVKSPNLFRSKQGHKLPSSTPSEDNKNILSRKHNLFRTRYPVRTRVKEISAVKESSSNQANVRKPLSHGNKRIQNFGSPRKSLQDHSRFQLVTGLALPPLPTKTHRGRQKNNGDGATNSHTFTNPSIPKPEKVNLYRTDGGKSIDQNIALQESVSRPSVLLQPPERDAFQRITPKPKFQFPRKSIFPSTEAPIITEAVTSLDNPSNAFDTNNFNRVTTTPSIIESFPNPINQIQKNDTQVKKHSQSLFQSQLANFPSVIVPNDVAPTNGEHIHAPATGPASQLISFQGQNIVNVPGNSFSQPAAFLRQNQLLEQINTPTVGNEVNVLSQNLHNLHQNQHAVPVNPSQANAFDFLNQHVSFPTPVNSNDQSSTSKQQLSSSSVAPVVTNNLGSFASFQNPTNVHSTNPVQNSQSIINSNSQSVFERFRNNIFATSSTTTPANVPRNNNARNSSPGGQFAETNLQNTPVSEREGPSLSSQTNSVFRHPSLILPNNDVTSNNNPSSSLHSVNTRPSSIPGLTSNSVFPRPVSQKINTNLQSQQPTQRHPIRGRPWPQTTSQVPVTQPISDDTQRETKRVPFTPWPSSRVRKQFNSSTTFAPTPESHANSARRNPFANFRRTTTLAPDIQALTLSPETTTLSVFDAWVKRSRLKSATTTTPQRTTVSTTSQPTGSFGQLHHRGSFWTEPESNINSSPLDTQRNSQSNRNHFPPEFRRNTAANHGNLNSFPNEYRINSVAHKENVNSLPSNIGKPSGTHRQSVNPFSFELRRDPVAEESNQETALVTSLPDTLAPEQKVTSVAIETSTVTSTTTTPDITEKKKVRRRRRRKMIRVKPRAERNDNISHDNNEQ